MLNEPNKMRASEHRISILYLYLVPRDEYTSPHLRSKYAIRSLLSPNYKKQYLLKASLYIGKLGKDAVNRLAAY